MKIDNFIASYDFNEIHTIRINSSPTQVMHSIKDLTPYEFSFIFHVLFAIRLIPEKLFGKTEKIKFTKGTPLLDQLFSQGFILLDEEENIELVFGTIVPETIGRFWNSSNSLTLGGINREDFIKFGHHQYIKVAANFHLENDTNGITKLTTETRIKAHSPQALKKFSSYWRVIYPGSYFIRVLWLRAIKRNAEKEK
jgi:hypothetical protein